MLKAETKKVWAYLCLMRPPMPGAIPMDGLDFVDWREGKSLSGHHYWGRAVYTRKLTEEEVRLYELEETALVVTD